MPSEKTKSSKSEQKPKCSCHCTNNKKTIYSLIFVAILLAVIGAGSGIYASIQANRALNYIDKAELIDETDYTNEETVLDDDQAEETSFGLPSSKDSIEYISIFYNDGKDYIDAIRDEDEGDEIEYYAYNEEEGYIGDTEETDVSNIFQYVMDNVLQYLGDNESTDEDTWGIEVSSAEGDSFIGGTGTAPDWFNDLLKELNVDQKGYKSNNFKN